MHGGATYAIKKVLILEKSFFCWYNIRSSPLPGFVNFSVAPPVGFEPWTFVPSKLHSSTELAGLC